VNFGCFGFGYGEKREMMYLREYWERARNICFERRGHAIEVMGLWDLVYLGLAMKRGRERKVKRLTYRYEKHL
jgi:hypothetical protein